MDLVSVPELARLVFLCVFCLVVVVLARMQNASEIAEALAGNGGTVSRRRLHRRRARRMGRPPLLILVLVLALGLAISSTPVLAQSTFGSVIGTVSDSSGAVVKGASVTLVNVDTAVERKVATDNTGGYSFFNLDAGKYNLTVQAQGFQRLEFSNLDLQARETKRVDASLKIGAPTETVNVQGESAGVITTDESNLTVTRTGQELADLPVAIYSRSNGSTSPISTLTTQSGVQTDTSGNLIIAGTTPALLSVTLDGISGMNIEYAGPLNELFPSFNSISEMKVSEINNNAEFSGVSDITTTSKGNALTVEAHKRFTNGLQFDSSYVFTRDLSDAGGSNPTAIPTEPPQFVSDRFDYGLDYGNVIYDRRHRFVTTYLYELPFGRGKKFLGGSSDVVNGLLARWLGMGRCAHIRKRSFSHSLSDQQRLGRH